MNDKEEVMSDWQPKRWLAVLLTFLFIPLGMMYIGKLRWLTFYVILLTALISTAFSFPGIFFQPDIKALSWVLPLMAAIHAYYLSGQSKSERPWYSHWYAITGLFLLLFIPHFLINTFVLQYFRMPSESMMPTIHTGDIFKVNKWGCGNHQYFGFVIKQQQPTDDCQVQAGDVVVFQYPPNPSDMYVKRVVGLPGDHVQFIDNRLFINGKVVWLKVHQDQGRTTVYEEVLGDRRYQVMYMNTDHFRNFKFTDVKVPKGHYFVLGDNRDNSSDSRIWGLVPANHLIGRVVGR
ncbi:signal peptidase I [Marinicella sediminis]|uniref:Signal peptidase I n=1 Tax=Marinicella sediminis TaxID=1792834 RepID=A0ABV7J9J2_9GAMM|nr:signal peptidase I [Marinicella sediminis]